MSYFEQILAATHHKTMAVQPLTSHLKKHSSKTNKTYRTQVEKQGQTDMMFVYGPLHMNEPVLGDQQELIYISTVWTQDVV